MDKQAEIGIVVPVRPLGVLFRVRVYISDEAHDIQCLYFETQVEADKFLSSLPEATR